MKLHRSLADLNPAYAKAVDQFFAVVSVNENDPGLEALWDEVQLQARIAEQQQLLEAIGWPDDFMAESRGASH